MCSVLLHPQSFSPSLFGKSVDIFRYHDDGDENDEDDDNIRDQDLSTSTRRMALIYCDYYTTILLLQLEACRYFGTFIREYFRLKPVSSTDNITKKQKTSLYDKLGQDFHFPQDKKISFIRPPTRSVCFAEQIKPPTI